MTYIAKVRYWISDGELGEEEYPTDFIQTGKVTKIPFSFAYKRDFEFKAVSIDMERVCDDIRHLVADNAISHLMACRITELASKPGMSVFVDLNINRRRVDDRVLYDMNPYNHTYQFVFRL